jgi:hypothetical protein
LHVCQPESRWAELRKVVAQTLLFFGGVIRLRMTKLAKLQDVYILAAENDEQTLYWAAALPADQCIAAVRQHVGDDWSIRRTTRRLSEEELGTLRLPEGRVRRLRFVNW